MKYPRSYGQYTLAAIERLSDSELHHHAHPAMIRDLCRRVKELEELPPIDLTQLPAYIELQKRLALAEAERDAALRQSDEWMGRCHIADVDGMRWHERAKQAEAKLEAVRKWAGESDMTTDDLYYLYAALDDQ